MSPWAPHGSPWASLGFLGTVVALSQNLPSNHRLVPHSLLPYRGRSHLARRHLACGLFGPWASLGPLGPSLGSPCAPRGPWVPWVGPWGVCACLGRLKVVGLGLALKRINHNRRCICGWVHILSLRFGWAGGSVL